LKTIGYLELNDLLRLDRGPWRLLKPELIKIVTITI